MGRAIGAILHAVAQLLAGVCSALFIATTVVVLLLISAEGALLNADTYKRALAEQRIYERIPALAAEQLGALETFLSNPCEENPLICRIDGASPELQACLTDALGGEAVVDIGSLRREPTEAELQLAQPCLDQFGPSPAQEEDSAGVGGEEGDSAGPGAGGEQMGFLKNLTPEDWERLISTLFPPDELQLMTEQALDQAFAFLDGDVESARVSLVALRGRLTGQAGQEIIQLLLAAQPPCTEEQLAQLTADLSGGEGDLVLCQPRVEEAEALMSPMRDRFEALVAEMPDEAVIIKSWQPPAPTGDGGQLGEDPSQAAHISREVPQGDDPSHAAPPNRGGPLGDDPLAALRILLRWLWLSLLLPLAMLLGVTIFGVRSRQGWLRWWGIPMLIAGLLTVGLGITAVPALDWAWASYIAAKLPPLLSASMPGIARAMADSVAGELAQWVVLSGAVPLLLGLAAVIGSFHVKSRKSAPAPQPGLA